jgi:addiction module HigA family antidote
LVIIMTEPLRNQYEPDEVSPPGETLQEIIDDRGMTQAELATRMGRPKKTINEIIQGKAAITPETALQLERVLDVPADFWVNREKNYRASLARRGEKQLLSDWSSWVRQFPVGSMVRYGWLQPARDDSEHARHILQFFGVASPDAWDHSWSAVRVAFRRSAAAKSTWHALAAWLRAGELEGLAQDLPAFDTDRFTEALQSVRSLTAKMPRDFADRLREQCAAAGVALALVPELPKAPVSGATRWLAKERPLIQLSLRYKTDDQFWFSFFHEACHILRHSKKEVFIESGKPAEGDQEREANDFAARTLVPDAEYRRFIRHHDHFSKDAICKFAAAVGTSPGIVVGRLQHDRRLPYSHCNDLKMRLEWRSQGVD